MLQELKSKLLYAQDDLRDLRADNQYYRVQLRSLQRFIATAKNVAAKVSKVASGGRARGVLGGIVLKHQSG
jgi:hypothetical protein